MNITVKFVRFSYCRRKKRISEKITPGFEIGYIIDLTSLCLELNYTNKKVIYSLYVCVCVFVYIYIYILVIYCYISYIFCIIIYFGVAYIDAKIQSTSLHLFRLLSRQSSWEFFKNLFGCLL